MARPAIVLKKDKELPRRDDLDAEMKGVLGDHTIFGPITEAKVSLQFGRYGIEVLIDSVSVEILGGHQSWIRNMSRKFR